MVGNPCQLIKRFCTDASFKADISQSMIELTNGRITNVKYQNDTGIVYEYSNKTIKRSADLFYDETERVRLGILMTAIRRKMCPFFFIYSEHCETDLMQRFFASIVQSNGVQLIILSQLARLFLSFPLDKIVKSDNWRHIVLE
jgi:hypothetical protein